MEFGIRTECGFTLVELFCDLVCSVGIGWYFLGVLPMDTKEILGWYIPVI